MGIHLHEVAEHVICKKAQRKHAAVLGEAEQLMKARGNFFKDKNEQC
jgi:hypothetical protein